MRLKTLVAVAIAAALAVPLLSQAQSEKPAAGATTPGSGMADKDKDGSISREEAKGTPYEKDFDKLDKNKDGKLSRDELTPAPAGAGATQSTRRSARRRRSRCPRAGDPLASRRAAAARSPRPRPLGWDRSDRSGPGRDSGRARRLLLGEARTDTAAAAKREAAEVHPAAGKHPGNEQHGKAQSNTWRQGRPPHQPSSASRGSSHIAAAARH